MEMSTKNSNAFRFDKKILFALSTAGFFYLSAAPL